MKKLLMGSAILFALSSCGGGWSSAEKEQVTKTCVSQAQAQAGMTSEKAEDYCDCMAEKLEDKYPKASDANSISASDPAVTEMAKDCLK